MPVARLPALLAGGASGAGGGYVRLATPSFTPGPGDSPLMTWGELEGTPLRLEQEDTPVDIGGSGAGPHFRMPEVIVRVLFLPSHSSDSVHPHAGFLGNVTGGHGVYSCLLRKTLLPLFVSSCCSEGMLLSA